MEEYLNKMKMISDNLALVGAPIPVPDLIMQTLARLDHDYIPMVVHLANQENLTWIALQSKILTYERHLEHLNSVHSVSEPFAGLSFRSDLSSSSLQGSNGGRSQWRGRGRGNRGRYKNNQSSNKISCHLCRCPGHTIMNYFHHFDKSFMPPQNDFGNTFANAYYASAETVQDPAWYLDSGASNHVTNQLPPSVSSQSNSSDF